ncbi:hypothetical protein [Chitinivibrio alkaliphilus]|nr:hypothetical protein [Chitinivibrio alkaliphilus]
MNHTISPQKSPSGVWFRRFYSHLSANQKEHGGTLFPWEPADLVDQLLFLQDIFMPVSRNVAFDTLFHWYQEESPEGAYAIPLGFLPPWIPVAYTVEEGGGSSLWEVHNTRLFIVKENPPYPVFYIDIHERTPVQEQLVPFVCME